MNTLLLALAAASIVVLMVALLLRQQGRQDDADQDVHHRSCEEHCQAHPRAGSRQPPWHFWVVFPFWAYETTQGDPVQGKGGPVGFKQLDDARRETDPEFLYLDLQQAGHQKVPKFMQ